MIVTFSAERMLARCNADPETRELLDPVTVAFIRKLDGKQGQDYNWQSVVNGFPLVWIEPDEDIPDGAFVALCDCV